MADTKISALPNVTSVIGTELIPVVLGGANKTATVNQIKTYLGVSGTNTGDQDLSGLVAKTTTVNGHALSTNVVVTAADVGLGSVDNTSDADKPISTATSTALSGKQATLVSGTNIKTVGGVSILGSGDIAVGGTGTVTSISVVSSNGLSGTVATATTTPSITLSTTVTGIVKGNGTALSAAAAGTDYLAPPSGTSILKANSGGALANASAGTDYVAPGGALGSPSSGNLSSCTADGTSPVGFRDVPQNSQSTAYTTVLADAGKHLLHPAADTTARTFTIDSNANVAYRIGTAITFVNQNGAGVVTIAITSDTMRLAGAGTTGSRTLAANGVATALKIATTEWIISGTGLT